MLLLLLLLLVVVVVVGHPLALPLKVIFGNDKKRKYKLEVGNAEGTLKKGNPRPSTFHLFFWDVLMLKSVIAFKKKCDQFFQYKFIILERRCVHENEWHPWHFGPQTQGESSPSVSDQKCPLFGFARMSPKISRSMRSHEGSLLQDDRNWPCIPRGKYVEAMVIGILGTSSITVFDDSFPTQ